jgi:PAS domain S-box-containing protein
LTTIANHDLEQNCEAPSADEQLEASLAQQMLLANLSQQALQGTDPQHLLNSAMLAVGETLEVPIAAVSRLLPNGRELQVEAALGLKEETASKSRIKAGTASQAGFTLEYGKPVIVSDYASEPRFETTEVLARHQAVSGLSVVIMGRRKPYGVLSVHTIEPRSFSPRNAHCLQGVANILGTAIERHESDQALKDSESALAAVLDNVFDGILTIDEKGIIVSFNRSACQLLGYSAEEVIGKNVSMFMPEPYASEHNGHLETYLETGKKNVIGRGREIVGKRADGTVFPISLAVSEVLIGQQRMFTGVVRDISERRKSEEALQRVEDRNRTMQLKHTELERVSVAGELAGIVAHEIRTPLNALSITVQMVQRLLRRNRDEDRPRTLELTDTLRGEIQRINVLLEDYLQVLRRPRKKKEDAFSLDSVVEDAVRFVSPSAANSKIDVVCSSSHLAPRVRGDEDRLRQVLLNLLLNAIQAMPDGGKIRISMVHDKQNVNVSISDSGDGISPENLQRVFEPFVTTKQKGTGLGLAICERLMREMGGKISAHSQPGEGATFVLSLPCADDPIADEKPND